MLFSEKNRMKVYTHQWLVGLLSPLLPLVELRTRGYPMVSGVQTPSQCPEMGQSPETWACKRLSTKHFHEVSLGNQHPYLLKSRYGKVSN